jgi:FAD-dependent urate hydroxylase
VLDHMPYLFYRFPQDWKDSYNSIYESGATYWLRDRVKGKVGIREDRTVTKCAAVDGKINLTLSDGESLPVDHVVQATGYKVDLSRLTMLDPALRAIIQTDRSIPILNGQFESTVPGLYFVGITSLRAFGPLYRFVAGCGAAARRVEGAIARSRVGTSVRARRRGMALATSTSPLPR